MSGALYSLSHSVAETPDARSWYGWQTLMSDVLGLAALFLAIPTVSVPLGVAGFGLGLGIAGLGLLTLLTSIVLDAAVKGYELTYARSAALQPWVDPRGRAGLQLVAAF